MIAKACTKLLLLLLLLPQSPAIVTMEDEFLNLGLDIIGLGVFNFDFGSFDKQAPVIKVGWGGGRQASTRHQGGAGGKGGQL